MLKKIISVMTACALAVSIAAVPGFAASNVKVDMPAGGGYSDYRLLYTIPGVIETKKYPAIVPAEDSRNYDMTDEWIPRDGSDVTVYVVPVGTKINVGGTYNVQNQCLKLVNGKLTNDPAESPEGTLTVNLKKPPEAEGPEPYTNDSFVQFNKEGFYAFTAYQNYVTDTGFSEGLRVLYVTNGGKAPAGGATTGTSSISTTLSCDTNGTIDLAANQTYTAKITIPGNTKTFRVTVGDGKTAAASLIKKEGLNYYYQITPKGRAGSGTGIYASVNGAKAQLLFGVNVTEAVPVSVKSDTTGRLTMKKGNTYWYKMTVSDGKTPASFTTGNSNVVRIAKVKNSGNGVYLVQVAAIGLPGQGTAVYSTLKGGKATAMCEIVIA